MVERSQNGWVAAEKLPLRKLEIDGVAFLPGIRDNDDVATVLGYVAQQFNDRVEKLVNPGCWGYSYRANRNDPNSLSNHSSGTAVDVNAPKHPNGVPTSKTFTPKQIAEVHKILGEVDNAVRWGGDYTGTPDAMHFEINVDPATLAVVADKIGDDMFDDKARATLERVDARVARLAEQERKRYQANVARLKAVRDELEMIEATTKDASTKKQVARLRADVAALAADNEKEE